MLSYRRLEQWIDWQCEKNGVPIIVVEPKGTSTTCPMCSSKLTENSYRKMRCRKCGFEADRDTVAILNIEKRALKQMGGPLTTPTAPQRTDVDPNRCGEPISRQKRAHAIQGVEEVRTLSHYGLKQSSRESRNV
jgi:transposase